MDPERIVFCVILTVVLGVGGFIFWGPSDKYKRKPGRIGGLVNSGLTCFLNTLLQALASCPSMLEWLSQQPSVSDTLTNALNEVLLVLNGQHPTIYDDPYTPSEVIKSLSLKGWVITPGEQDAHELFHVIMTTLTEETSSDHNQIVSISDILLNTAKDNHFIKMSPRKIQSDISHLTFRAVSRLSSLTLTNSVASCPAFLPPQTALPFQGLLTSQLECTTCNYKSAVRYDKFDSLSLHLPNIIEKVFLTKLTLRQLLDKFVSTEIVKDVQCEKCNKHRDEASSVKTSAKKTLNFGKLPKCLCFHIQRSTWQRNGQPFKRCDYIQFPEFLSMKEYTYMEVQKRKAHQSRHNNELIDLTLTRTNHASNGRKHIYRLSAVIVHTGNLEGGHFVTYRRSPVKEHKWYYTSDAEVRESSLEEALSSYAYMLFYNEYIPKDGASIPYPSQALVRNSNA